MFNKTKQSSAKAAKNEASQSPSGSPTNPSAMPLAHQLQQQQSLLSQRAKMSVAA